MQNRIERHPSLQPASGTRLARKRLEPLHWGLGCRPGAACSARPGPRGCLPPLDARRDQRGRLHDRLAVFALFLLLHLVAGWLPSSRSRIQILIVIEFSGSLLLGFASLSDMRWKIGCQPLTTRHISVTAGSHCTARLQPMLHFVAT